MKKVLSLGCFVALTVFCLLFTVSCGWLGDDDEPIDLSVLEGEELARALLTESDRVMSSLHSYHGYGRMYLDIVMTSGQKISSTSTIEIREYAPGTDEYRTSISLNSNGYLNGVVESSDYLRQGYYAGKAYFATTYEGKYSKTCGSISLEKYLAGVSKDSPEIAVSMDRFSSGCSSAVAERLESGDINATYSGFTDEVVKSFDGVNKEIAQIADGAYVSDLKLGLITDSVGRVKSISLTFVFKGDENMTDIYIPEMAFEMEFDGYNEVTAEEFNFVGYNDIGDLTEIYEIASILEENYNVKSGKYDFTIRQEVGAQESTTLGSVEYYYEPDGDFAYDMTAAKDGVSIKQNYKDGTLTLASGGNSASEQSTDMVEKQRIKSITNLGRFSIGRIISLRKSETARGTRYIISLADPSNPLRETYGQNVDECITSVEITVKDGKLIEYYYRTDSKGMYITGYSYYSVYTPK